MDKGGHDTTSCEFDFKKNFLRETSSGKCECIPFFYKYICTYTNPKAQPTNL